MAEQPFLGTIFMFGGNFAPSGYAFCDGSLMQISQNTALFSILGTTYGGDGTATFALPDLRGRVPVSFGQGPGLSPYTLGQAGGTETVTLTTAEMPAHNHMIQAGGTLNTKSPANNFLANGVASTTNTPATTMSPAAITQTGGSQPHPNIQPYLTINFIIALQGIFPSRG